MKIDCHTHIGKNSAAYRPKEVENEIEKTSQDLLNTMKENDVEYAAVFSLPALPQMLFQENMLLLNDVREKKELIPFVFLDPRDKQYCIPLLETLSFAGIKLHPLAHGYVVSHPLCRPVLEYAAEKGYPVLIHSGWGELGSLRYIEKLAKILKRLKIIIAHMVLPDCLDVVARNENLWIDTSYAQHIRRIEQAVQICGSDKVIFGSDYPFSDQRLETLKIEYAKISDEEKKKIFSLNIKNLIKWSE